MILKDHFSLKATSVFALFSILTLSVSVSAENSTSETNQMLYLKLKQNAGKQLEQINKNMVRIPAGKLIVNADSHSPVSVKSFEISRYEVTQEQWQSLMIGNPSHFTACPECPVEKVSWNDVQLFIERLNQVSGENYRLPTETEWEYACRAGSASDKYCGGNDVNAVGWYASNSKGRTQPVGLKQANGYGLYDMSGNILEWLADCSDEATRDSYCIKHAYRGGYWGVNAGYLRPDTRNWGYTDSKGDFLGFRLAR